MDTTIPIDLSQVAKELNLPLHSIQQTLELLDEGNTVPFITRYRKDQTGALDDEQVRQVQAKVAKLRALAERKQTILKSIEAQGKLTPELTREIAHAFSTKRLEDLYLPYKPKKQTLATIARQRGLEPLAIAIVETIPAGELEEHASKFISEEQGVTSVADALQGVRHLLAERYSERADLRDRLRKLIRQTGKLVATHIEPSESTRAPEVPPTAQTASPTAVAASESHAATADVPHESDERAGVQELKALLEAHEAGELDDEHADDEHADDEHADDEHADDEHADEEHADEEHAEDEHDEHEPDEHEEAEAEHGEQADQAPASEATTSTAEAPANEQPPAQTETRTRAAMPSAAVQANASPPPQRPRTNKRANARNEKKQKKRQKLEAAFKDYFHFSESLSRIPPHRILAINRGERARILRVKIELDQEALFQSAAQVVISTNHPHREFLTACLRDAMQRLILPSLEREARRELTEAAEQHALEVFVRNLRKLLLQPPVRGRRVLAIDPGFRSGCKLIAIDEFGNVLGHDLIHVVGRDERKHDARAKLANMIRQHNLSVVAIGNGTGCRETEQLVADAISTELTDTDVAYVVVNEAGASVYSTSPIGREELPDHDPVLRSAISIGRRLLDPLSELVKINPANIGVGLYQHDVKAKHLRDSLDAVVESCVNFVGVDVNTASPALLRYVSGLNQLTARRLYEYRRENGPFRSREDFKKVPGFGDSAFVQAAGFLKIPDADNPLDATWIHPESYEIARRVLEKLGGDIDVLRSPVTRAAPRPQEPAPDVAASPDTANADTANADTANADTANADVANADVANADTASSQAASEAGPSEPATEAPSVNSEHDASGGTLSVVPAVITEPYTGVESHLALRVDLVPESTPSETAVASSPTPAETSVILADEALNEHLAENERRLAARAAWLEKASQANASSVAQELGVGELLLQDILSSLTRPGRDPRDDLPPPVFRRGIMKLEDLRPGMELTGTVLNVVDFGAFVDIGLTESGLVHISRLADRYIKDPHEVVGVGDTVKVWVLDVDKERRRVSLTAVAPGAERKKPEPRPKPAPQQKAATPPPARAAAATQKRPVKPPHTPRRDRGKGARQPRGRSWIQKSSLPAPPLTKAMEEGKEPLRSFSDLLQFFEKKQHPDEGDQAEE